MLDQFKLALKAGNATKALAIISENTSNLYTEVDQNNENIFHCLARAISCLNRTALNLIFKRAPEEVFFAQNNKGMNALQLALSLTDQNKLSPAKFIFFHLSMLNFYQILNEQYLDTFKSIQKILLDETNTNKGSSLPKKPSSESLSLNGDYSCRENSTPIDFPDEILNEYRKKCPILYQDSSCVIVNKDFSMLVFPVSKELDRKEPTLVELFPKLLNKIKGLYPAVHRLDRETSGTIAIAETEGSYHQLKQIFFDRSHRLKKGYIAVGFDQRGMLTPGAEYIVTDQIRKSYFHKEGQQELCADGGRRAESRFRVLSKTGDLVILWVEIITGVQHQIRVHSSQSLGAPLVGDNTYGSCRFNYSRAHRPLLHAFMLAFEGSQRDICVYAPLPEDMHVVIELNFKLGLRISQSRILLHPNTEELESNETETVSPSFLKPTPTLFRFFTQLYPLSPVTNAGFRVLSKISDPKYILPVNDLGNSTAGQSF